MQYSFAKLAAFVMAATAVIAAPAPAQNVEREIVDKRAFRWARYTVTVTKTVYAQYPPRTTSTKAVFIQPTTTAITTTTTVAEIPKQDPSSTTIVVEVPQVTSTAEEVKQEPTSTSIPPPAPTETKPLPVAVNPAPVVIPTTTSIAVVIPTPAPAPAPVDNSGLSSFAQEYVNIHNQLRAKHGAPALKFSQTLADYAQAHVQDCKFAHSSPYKYGENLAAGYRNPTAAVQAWYNEISEYDFNAAKFSSGTGHFTQIVWESAKEVGCGSIQCNGKNGTPGIYLSCNYDKGNIIGQFAANVKRPI